MFLQKLFRRSLKKRIGKTNFLCSGFYSRHFYTDEETEVLKRPRNFVFQRINAIFLFNFSSRCRQPTHVSLAHGQQRFESPFPRSFSFPLPSPNFPFARRSSRRFPTNQTPVTGFVKYTIPI